MSATEWTKQLQELSKTLKVPLKSNKIWKDECAFSFSTPFSKGGLFLNLSTFQSYSGNFIGLDHDRTGNKIYLNIKHEKFFNKVDKKEGEKKLEILVDEIVDVKKSFDLCIYPDIKSEQLLHLNVTEGNNFSVFIADKDVTCPELLLNLLKEVILRNDETKETEIKNWSAEEEEENLRPVSIFADAMQQVENPVQLSNDPKTWKCEESGITENIWLNLHDGYIGSGRRNWDGSGGTGAALKHFEETGKKYPLCLKLGTVEPDGKGGYKADIYSYDESEDKMVKNPDLAKHLAHFGLNIKLMTKTDKTLLEMELDLNEKHIFSAITENEKSLVPHYGPGFVGLKNLGNTCYMNSVMQVIFKLEPFQKRFFYGSSDEMRKIRTERFFKSGFEPQTNSELQMIKLASALSDPSGDANIAVMSDREEQGDKNSLSVSPKILKDCYCSAHPEFKKKAQQDSEEFFEYFLTKLEEIDKGKTAKDLNLDHLLKNEELNPSKLFSHVIEERLLCSQSQMVRYKKTTSEVLSLNIPISLFELEKIIEANKKPGKDVVLPTVDFDKCLNSSLGQSTEARAVLTDYISPATGKPGVAYQTSGLRTFPKLLCVQLRRYVISEQDLAVHKLTCLVPVPTTLDLSKFASNGVQEGETLLPDNEDKATTQNKGGSDFDAKLNQMLLMGLPENPCRHGLLKNNMNPDLAVGWVFENMSNPIYAIAPEMPAPTATKPALSGNDLEEKIKTVEAENNGSAKYKLRGFVSHMGSNTASGHYVCHIYDDSSKRWVLFNDEKVALSEQPPLAHGYLYFYERED